MGLGRFSLFCLEPSLLHFLQEILGDREAGGITYYGVGITEGTFSCRRLIREVIRDFGWREDFAAAEAAALFRLLYLFLVSDAAIVSLAEDSVFLFLFFLLLLSLLQSYGEGLRTIVFIYHLILSFSYTFIILKENFKKNANIF